MSLDELRYAVANACTRFSSEEGVTGYFPVNAILTYLHAGSHAAGVYTSILVRTSHSSSKWC